ncbi:MAG: DUF881 domain-containing protein [Actinobacteria bacterium]|nr:DUF881 domain-containing protein [Actinomycetota bacterium]
MLPQQPRRVRPSSSSARHRRNRALTTTSLFICLGVLGFLVVVLMRTQGALGNDLQARSVDELGRLVGMLSQEVDRLQQEETDLTIKAIGSHYELRSDTEVVTRELETLKALEVLVGAVPSRGDGVRLLIGDSENHLSSYEMCLIINELRSAGAEAIVMNGRRIDYDSGIGGKPGRLALQDSPLVTPLVVEVVGDREALLSAVKMPGGLVSMLSQLPGVEIDVETAADISVPPRSYGLRTFDYAVPID